MQGLDKAETKEKFGDEQFLLWRRSYDTPPPPIEEGQPSGVDERYADLAPDVVPLTECLKDVLVRMLPYWYDAVVPDLLAGRTTLVAAHGNSLRALVKHLDGISDDDIAELNIPTGIPLRYELDSSLRVISSGYLDPEAAEEPRLPSRRRARTRPPSGSRAVQVRPRSAGQQRRRGRRGQAVRRSGRAARRRRRRRSARAARTRRSRRPASAPAA